jgi:Double-GTPase 1
VTTPIHHSIVGLPRSGKTTFLAALWHLIDAGEVTTKLVLDKLIGNHEYLNNLVAVWRRCEEVPRTSIAAEGYVSIHFAEPGTGRKAVLSFPDLSGESFDQQVATRRCRPSYVEGLSGDGGIMLFVMGDRAQDGIALVDLAPVLAGVEPKMAAEQVRDWTPGALPEQVRLVELLQFVQGPPFERKRRKLAVVISAWDVIRKVGQGTAPREWLERELPLLYQFLRANPASFEFRVYGISAQGGSVKGDARGALLSKTPSERIECVGEETTPHDLTRPVLWLMEKG